MATFIAGTTTSASPCRKTPSKLGDREPPPTHPTSTRDAGRLNPSHHPYRLPYSRSKTAQTNQCHRATIPPPKPTPVSFCPGSLLEPGHAAQTENNKREEESLRQENLIQGLSTQWVGLKKGKEKTYKKKEEKKKKKNKKRLFVIFYFSLFS